MQCKSLALTLSIALAIFSGCSTKEYYEPVVETGDWEISAQLKSHIVDRNYDGAVLGNGDIITREGLLKVKLPKDYRFVSHSGGWIIASKIDGELLLIDEAIPKLQQKFELKKTIAGASVQGDILAVLFASNEKALYSIQSKELIFKAQGNPPSAVDSRIVNPYFLNELVLFLTLDGKIDIISSESKKLLRSMIVSSQEHFNNIIYFNVINNNMFAATSYRLISLGDKEMRQSYELRDILFDKDGVWLSTKQGEVYSLTPSLQLKAKKKFPFAHFLGMIVAKEKIYLLESQGFLIEIDKDLIDYKVYEVDIRDGYVFVSDTSFFFDDAYIDITKK
ncbi:MAG: hypothetical protein U9R50_04855 [Campylobacterota bacterium]|nr:hypothetical protein [Campylobacterota bacterium]